MNYYKKQAIADAAREKQQIRVGSFDFWPFYDKMLLMKDNNDVIEMMLGGKRTLYWINHAGKHFHG